MTERTTLSFATRSLPTAWDFTKKLEQQAVGARPLPTIQGSDTFAIRVILDSEDVALANQLAQELGLGRGGNAGPVQRVKSETEGGEAVGKGSKGAKSAQVKETKKANAPAPAPAAKATPAAGDGAQAYKAYPRCPAKGCGRYMKDMEKHWAKEPSHRPGATSESTETPAQTPATA